MEEEIGRGYQDDFTYFSHSPEHREHFGIAGITHLLCNECASFIRNEQHRTGVCYYCKEPFFCALMEATVAGIRFHVKYDKCACDGPDASEAEVQ